MLNASQFENDWVINASDPNKSADYIVNYEQDFNTWWNTYKAEDGNTPTWWQSSTYLNASKLANVVYNTDQYTASDGITRSQDPNQPYKSPVMYFYDGSSKSYDHLTCSFEMQAAMLQGTTPVPTGKTYCPAIPAQGRLERC